MVGFRSGVHSLSRRSRLISRARLVLSSLSRAIEIESIESIESIASIEYRVYRDQVYRVYRVYRDYRVSSLSRSSLCRLSRVSRSRGENLVRQPGCISISKLNDLFSAERHTGGRVGVSCSREKSCKDARSAFAYICA